MPPSVNVHPTVEWFWRAVAIVLVLWGLAVAVWFVWLLATSN